MNGCRWASKRHADQLTASPNENKDGNAQPLKRKLDLEGSYEKGSYLTEQHRTPSTGSTYEKNLQNVRAGREPAAGRPALRWTSPSN